MSLWPWLGVSTLAVQNDNAVRMDASAKYSLDAARARSRIIASSRAEFRSALDPTNENREAANKHIEESLADYRALMTEVEKTADSQAQAMLPSLRQAFSAYEGTLKATMAATEVASSSKVTETAAKLRDTVMKSRDAAEDLQVKIKALADRLDQRVQEFEKLTAEEYSSGSRQLIAISSVGVLIGILLGFLVGQHGVARPIRSIVETLQRLASGDYNIDVHSTGRKDEVGDVAKAALVFKENGLAKVRMEAEQKESEASIASQRKSDMHRLADGFEAAVGEIIKTVSSASTELEASANTLRAA
jgi:methyl-accepting chemotaxis protein